MNQGKPVFILYFLKQEISKKVNNLHYAESLVLSLLLNIICVENCVENGKAVEVIRSQRTNSVYFYELFLLFTELAYISLVFALHFFILNIRIMYLKLECCLKRICIF